MVNITDGEGTISVNGCAIRYWDRGNGSPVVLIHGAGADHVMFDDQAKHLLASGYRVITWDQRGHGASRPTTVPFTAETALSDLRTLIDERELDHPVLIGQSLGGNLAQAFVRRHPKGAQAIVVIGSAWNAAPLTRGERILLSLAAPLLTLVPRRKLPALMAQASAATPHARADATRAFSALSKSEFIAVWSATAALLDPDPGYKTPVPLCLIRGAEDRTGNIAAMMPRWAKAEGVEQHVIPDAGHICNQDAPEKVNAILSTFLDGLK